jgi:multisubunit Na+/H+ antiporter MnhB subunit
MPAPRDLHRSGTRLLSGLMVLIGVALVVRALGAAGGGLAIGVVLGVLFVLAGAGRLYVLGRRR